MFKVSILHCAGFPFFSQPKRTAEMLCAMEDFQGMFDPWKGGHMTEEDYVD